MSNSLYNSIKKFAYIVNEGFNFDDELDDSESGMNAMVDNMIDRLYNVQSMVAEKMDVKYVLLNHLHFDLDVTDRNLNWKYFISFKETSARQEILHLIIGTFSGIAVDYELLLTNNNWFNVSYSNALQMPEIKDVVHAYGECYRSYFQMKENDDRDNSNQMISIWVSPDKGVVYITNKTVARGNYVISRAGAFLLTGLVYYRKIKNRQLTPAEINVKCMVFWKNLLKQYNESIVPSNHYKLLYDKNGYPRLAAIVHKDLIHHYVMPKCIRKTYADGWTGRLETKHPNVAIRKDSEDGIVYVGVFMPWKLPKELCKLPMYTYSIPTLNNEFDLWTSYQNNPDNFGLVVFQLSEKGKPLFDQFKINNYKPSKSNG